MHQLFLIFVTGVKMVLLDTYVIAGSQLVGRMKNWLSHLAFRTLLSHNVCTATTLMRDHWSLKDIMTDNTSCAPFHAMFFLHKKGGCSNRFYCAYKNIVELTLKIPVIFLFLLILCKLQLYIMLSVLVSLRFLF